MSDLVSLLFIVPEEVSKELKYCIKLSISLSCFIFIPQLFYPFGFLYVISLSMDSRTDVIIEDFDIKNGIISAFRYANKAFSYFFHIVFLECCKSLGVRPKGLQIRNSSFVEFIAQDIIASWNSTISSAEEQLLDTLLMGLVDKMFEIEKDFWKMLGQLEEEVESLDDIVGWWVKLMCHLEKEETRIIKRKKKKLCKLLSDKELKTKALERFDEHLKNFDFKRILYQHGHTLSPHMDNLINLLLIGEPPQNVLDETTDQNEEYEQTSTNN